MPKQKDWDDTLDFIGSLAAGLESLREEVRHLSTLLTDEPGADFQIDTWNVRDLAIHTAKIKNLAVTDAKINDLDVGKLTAGSLDVGISITTGGFIKVGTGTLDDDFTGVYIDPDHLVGQASGTDQFVLSTSTGKATAGAGAVTLDADGVTLAGGTGDTNEIKWKDSGTLIFKAQASYTGGATPNTNARIIAYGKASGEYAVVNINAFDAETGASYYTDFKVDSNDGVVIDASSAQVSQALTLEDTPLEITYASGDPIAIFDIGGTDKFTLGVDDSDSDKFKINSGGSLADPSDFEMDSSGNVEIAGTLSFNGGTSQASAFVPKDEPPLALSLASQSDVAYTDLDLTSDTSANARAVLLNLFIQDSGGANALLYVRKNGVTPTYVPYVRSQVASVYNNIAVAIPCDTGQVIEYSIDATGANTADVAITVLGYWE